MLTSALLCGSTSLNHDTSWYLIATERWLGGAGLYKDIIEVNPPLAFYLTAPAVWIADRIPALRPEMSFSLFMTFLGLVSIFWARLLLRRSLPSGGARKAMIAAAVVALFIVPMPVFGQREHLMIILVLPYVLLSAFQPQVSSTHRVAIGLFAAPGLALKPYFLVLPLATALIRVIQTKRLATAFTVDNLAIGFACLGYVLGIAILHPAYIHSIVPMAQEVYGAYEASASGVLLTPASIVVIGIAGFYLATEFNDHEANRSAQVLAVTVAAAAIFYIFQMRGWLYHRIPIHAFACIAATWIAISRAPSSGLSGVYRGLLLALLGIFTLLPSLKGPYRQPAAEYFGKYLDSSDRSFLFLSAHVWLTYPMANLYVAEPTSGYSSLWLIPGAVNRLRTESLHQVRFERVSEILEFARRSTAEDFLAGKPKIVFVDVRDDKPYFDDAVTFDYLSFFRKNQKFAHEWRNYRRIFESADFEVWQRTNSKSRPRRKTAVQNRGTQPESGIPHN